MSRPVAGGWQGIAGEGTPMPASLAPVLARKKPSKLGALDPNPRPYLSLSMT